MSRELNPVEASVLLYLERCLVDNQGFVEGKGLRMEHFNICRQLHKEGLIQFDTIPLKHVQGISNHRVAFTGWAWQLASRYRREKAERFTPTINNKAAKKEPENNQEALPL